MKNTMNMLKVLLITILFNLPVIASNDCSNTHNHDFATNNTYTHSDTLAGWGNNFNQSNEHYYFKIPSDGKISISLTGNNVQYRYKTSGCPAYNSGETTSSFTVSKGDDFNLIVQSFKENGNRSYKLRVTFTPNPETVWIKNGTSTLAYTSPSPYLNNSNATESLTIAGASQLEVSISGTLETYSSGTNCGFDYVTITDSAGTISQRYCDTINDTFTAVGPTVTLNFHSDESVVASGVTVSIEEAKDVSTSGRDFELRHQENLYGDVKVIGNTVLCIHNASGQCVEPSNSNSNKDADLQKSPQSWAKLSIPTNAEIVYARIYWQGRKKGTSSDVSWDSSSKNLAKTIKLKKEGASNYTTLTADIADFDSTTSSNAYIRTYSSSANAKDALDGSGKYYVDTTDFYTHTGKTNDDNPYDGLGAYGAWVLVVVYRDPDSDKARNVTIFDGFKQVTSDSGDIDVLASGFLTPKTEAVNSKLYVFAAEGDKYIQGDHLKMAGSTFNTTLADIAPTTNNAFNSRVDVLADRSPRLNNNNGIDIQSYDVGTTAGGKQIITNEETGAKFQFTSTQDTYFPSLIVFSTEIRMLDLCYDYTYGQDGYFYTAADVEKLTLEGTFNKDTPLEVKLYIENREDSDVIVNNLNMHIENIDTAQAAYKRDSTYIAKPNQNIVPLPDSGREVADGHDRNISIGSVGGLEHFYTYYGLNLNKESVNMPINAKIDYDLAVQLADGSIVNLGRQSLQLEDMEICQASTSYQPIYDKFNVVHVSETRTNTEFYLNLPTQVAGRTGNYYLESMDPNNLDQSKPIDAAIVAVEMIDVDGFHYATATCTDENAIVTSTKRVWSIFDNGYLIALDKNAMTTGGFFNQSIENAAFRISYNIGNDGNLIKIEKIARGPHSGNWAILNFTELAQGLEEFNSNLPPNERNKCVDPVVTDRKTYTTMPEACGNASSNNGLSPEDLIICNECVYGANTKKFCSRDNFSIRPEAYNVALSDMDQNDQTMTQLIDTNTPAPENIHLVAGYEYHFEVNATDHQNNMPTPRYNASGVNAGFIWSPIATATNCNDDSDITNTISFFNGKSVKDIPVNQVGKYQLEIVDSNWTKVDHVSDFMEHHVGPYFRTGTDCSVNSNVVQIESSATPQNGCDISSNHTNIEYGKTFTDMNLTFHPYKFDVQDIKDKEPKIGPDTRTQGQTFVYMDTPPIFNANNSDMSYNLNGTFFAAGYNNVRLSNFVTGCYADDVNMDLDYTHNSLPNIDSAPYLWYSIKDHNTTDDTVVYRPASGGNDFDRPIEPTSNTIPLIITQGQQFFAKNMNGSITMDLGYNYKRDYSRTLNPRYITFKDFNITDTINNNNPTNIYADLTNNHKIFGNISLDDNVTFVYGRAKSSQDFYETTENFKDTPVSIVVYCDQEPIICSAVYNIKNLTFGGTDEFDWYFSRGHVTNDNDGNVTLSASTGASVAPSDESAFPINFNEGVNDPDIRVTATIATRPLDVDIDFVTTTPSDTSRWLIYNKDKNEIPSPFYRVRFIGQSDWAGHGDTGHVVGDNASTKKNKRLGW